LSLVTVRYQAIDDSRVATPARYELPFVQARYDWCDEHDWKAQMSARIRVVIAKPGLDGHDRGAKVVARALRDAGMEVIYTGLHQTPEQIVETAIQEDADAIGLSVLSGAHMTLFRRVLELLGQREATDIVVFGGGIIPDADIPELEQLGVARIFTPGATTESIVDWVRTNVRTAVA
jgi:methylmalonyl-CoA mutase, C-terminal domain